MVFEIKDLYSFFAFPYNSEYILLATQKKKKTKREIIIKLITTFALLSQPLRGLENTLLWLKFSKKNKKNETTSFDWKIWERKREHFRTWQMESSFWRNKSCNITFIGGFQHISIGSFIILLSENIMEFSVHICDSWDPRQLCPLYN